MIGVNRLHIGAGGGSSNGLLTDLESYYKLDEASGTITDSHGSNDSTNEVGVSYGATGVINDAINFNANNEYVDFGDVLDFDTTDAFSVSFWVNMDAGHTAVSPILTKQETSGNWKGWRVQRSGSSNGYVVMFSMVSTLSNIMSVAGSTTVSGGSFYHIAITYDGSADASGVNIYVNGLLDTPSVASNNLSTTTVNAVSLLLGDWHTNATAPSTIYFDGDIDEVGIWSRELTSSDVTALYNSGSGLSYDNFTS